MIDEKMSIEDYHNHPAYGSTDLKRALRSPMHMHCGRTSERSDSKALRIGSAVHCAVLEPELFATQYYILPEFKGIGSKLRREEYVSARAQMTRLTTEEFAQVTNIAEAVHAHSLAKQMLASGLAERSHFWLDEYSGLTLKCRPDFYNDDGVIVDLKTCQDASPQAFAKSVANYQYHLQAALYMDGVEAQMGRAPGGFVFIAVESEPPHAVGIYILDDLSMQEGRRAYRRALEKIRDAGGSVNTHGYSTKLTQISLPHWAYLSEE
jgi:exodeoxyribonuclease VIII